MILYRRRSNGELENKEWTNWTEFPTERPVDPHAWQRNEPVEIKVISEDEVLEHFERLVRTKGDEYQVALNVVDGESWEVYHIATPVNRELINVRETESRS